MQNQTNGEIPTWVKDLKELIEKILVATKGSEEETAQQLQDGFLKENQAIAALKQGVETCLSVQTLFLNTLAQTAENHFQQQMQQLDIFRTLMGRLDVTQSIIRRDTSDLELRMADLQKRLQSVESQCNLIVDLLKKKED